MNRILTGLLCLVLVGCDDTVSFRARGATPHEDYVEALRAAGFAETAAARDWLAAAERALAQPLAAAVPLEEVGYLDPAVPAAVSLRVQLDRGQRVNIEATLEPAPDGQLFVDVFRAPADSSARVRHVAAADSGASALEYEPSRTGEYIIRVQPELLRGGRYRIVVRTAPTLAFPVSNAGQGAVGSRFGAPRDGGARDHHGIDIFAPRGTPVIAVTAGTVNRVQETAIGGRVVWLRDERRGSSIYYAHLDEQRVTSGQRVRAGDTIGTVGNTGNARTTPPHLHFGIYRRGEGAVDPFTFVAPPAREPPPLRADTSMLGAYARLVTPALQMPAGTALHVVGARGSSYRVALPDGTAGWVDAAALRAASDAAARLVMGSGCALRDRPAPNAAIRAELAAASSAAVLGSFGDFLLVRVDSLSGWTDCAASSA